MFASTTQWIRDKYNNWRNANEQKKTDSDSESKTDEQKFANAFQNFSVFFEKLSNTLEKDSYLQEFNNLGELFRKSGYFAGQWGIQEREIDSMAEMQILLKKNQIEEKCQNNQTKLNSEVEMLDKIRINADRDYKTKNSYYERLNRAYQYNHRQFSVVLGFIYGFFSIALILADIPLALELTKKGFNLKSDPNNPISNLFQYGTTDGFLYNFLQVLSVNWEVVLFAVGIAFCTIYIKIYYDDFIGVPLENLIKKSSESPREPYEDQHEEAPQSDNKRETVESEELNKIDESDESNRRDEIRDEIRRRFNRLWWVRFGVKTFVLLLLFFTILVLGYFRYSVVASAKIQDIPPTIIFLTYSTLTILFPIISGISGSLSLNCFHNWREKSKAEKKSAVAQKILLDATDIFRNKQEEQLRNQSFIKWLRKEDTIKQLKENLVSCYKFGYKFGYLHPEWTFGGDLFTRAEALRQRSLINPNKILDIGKMPDSFDINQNTIN